MDAEHGFDYALAQLKDGYKMRRKEWNCKDKYIKLAKKSYSSKW